MNMATFRELRAIHPRSDVAALVGMSNDDLRLTLIGAKMLYAGVKYQSIKSHGFDGDVPLQMGRTKAIREILSLRAKHDGRSVEERAAVEVDDDDEAVA